MSLFTISIWRFGDVNHVFHTISEHIVLNISAGNLLQSKISAVNIPRHIFCDSSKESLMIRKGTDNTMAKRKSTKWQTTIYQTYTYKTKVWVSRAPLKTFVYQTSSDSCDSNFAMSTKRLVIVVIQLSTCLPNV